MGPSKRLVPPPLGHALLGVVALALLSGCQQLSDLLGITDPWAGYYDTNENYIAGRGLDQQDLSLANYLADGKWTWAWRGDSDGATYLYMSLSSSADSPPSSLPSTTPVYELALANLYPGAGDFESPGNPTTNWTLVNSASSTPASGTSAIHGTQSIRIQTPIAGDYAYFDLGSIADHATSTGNHTYGWRFFLANGSSYAYQVAPVGSFDSSKTTLTNILATTDVLLPDLPVPPASSPALYFGAGTFLDFTMDDVRIIRSDIASDFRLRLRLLPSGETTKTLRSGYYEFSLWVKKPAHTFVAEPTAVQPYAASAVTLSMHALIPNPSGPQHAYPIDGSVDPASGLSYDAATGWVRLALRMSAGNIFTLDSSATSPVMELSVAPFNFEHPDAGSVEIADPELHYYKDGY
ncbi:MAG TPA: hypothetical protein VMV44_11870 [Rectinemataceae bacterium]|nr:hypothetical protein [Rectinemataceae bacterium]